jgi:pimeloyl-ACP methyl ester carboxylesterase
MEDVAGLPLFEVEFDREARLVDETQVTVALDALAGGQITDLLVFSHGWNNDKADARELCRDVFTRVGDALAAGTVTGVAGRRFAILAVLWPSKRFADSDLIPGGAAGAGDSDATLEALVDRLRREPIRLGVSTPVDPARQAKLDEAAEVISALEQDADARAQFADAVRAILSPAHAHPDDGSDDFFTRDAKELMEALAEPVPAPSLPEHPGGGAAGFPEAGAAGVLGDLRSGAKAAARRLLNFATYYQMKERAGTVGSTGLAAVLRRVGERLPGTRLHLIGHSFGGRLVTAATAALGAQVKPASLTLLQAAYSHNGFASRFDGTHDGSFRKVVTEGKVAGPILITCTRNDLAVGVAYPLASRIARQNAAALGDRDDPYGGIGRNGAVRTPEAEDGTLGEPGTAYAFRAGRLYNLNADACITGHSDIAKRQVAYALLCAVATT